jgi:hypothetical protein
LNGDLLNFFGQMVVLRPRFVVTARSLRIGPAADISP